MERVDCIVIGAGVVGLAVARRMAMAGVEVVVLEGEGAIGTHTSARNSEVIHAGIYYPTGSRKAELCVRGRHLLYGYVESHGIKHKRTGKLIVATTDEQVGQLEKIHRTALANGVDDIVEIPAETARAWEPEVRCAAALHSPCTGIVDSHGLMLAYQGEAEDHGAAIAFETPFLRAEVIPGGFRVTAGRDEPVTLECRYLVNAAGLWAPDVGRAIEGYDPAHAPTAYYARGVYFTLAGKTPFGRLVYPIPEHAGLGVHVTLDLAGRARFGPDVEWIDGIDYTFNESRVASFYEAIRSYWPGLADGRLMPGYTGIRPKISGPKDPAADFLIQGPATHGIEGLVHLYGIESPGLTSSLAIADVVADEIGLAQPVTAAPALRASA
ncbi:NAD(P)/FAD-dependent oxidoreductase [Chthonobacter albigriseus]|uniref:NAD(P)/FAD-dependent oxidoreductase n=1 Tax=Chthonobacter albigriseus TaxID=1683161 RepID=UPI0015EF68CE|nr:NAD(P)/FAD-dependent oxidoreductase [Chthonobacter albigriseus]